MNKILVFYLPAENGKSTRGKRQINTQETAIDSAENDDCFRRKRRLFPQKTTIVSAESGDLDGEKRRWD